MYATYSDGSTSNHVDLTVNIQASAPPPPPPPQNSSGPVISTSVQSFQVTVGQQGILSSSNLSASDAAYPDPSLISYNITSYPTQGALYLNGQLAHSFTQADINAGRVAYLSYMQAGLSSEATDALTYIVSDPSYRQTAPTTVNLKIEPLPPPPTTSQPYIDINSFQTVLEGGQIFVTGVNPSYAPNIQSNLHVTDPNPNDPYTGSSRDSAIVYTIVQGPTHGQLNWVTNYPTPWLPGQQPYYGQQVTKFTQNDLNNGWFIYKNDFTSGASDSFSFTVSDSFGGTIGLTTATIPIQPVNPIVLGINAGMFVTSGGESVVSPDWLRIFDNAPDAKLTLTLRQPPSHGTILLSGQLPSGSSFTVSELYQLSYRQDGGAAQSDQFSFAVTDAYGNSIPDLVVPITIGATALDKNTGALVGIGQSAVIEGQNLHVADPGMGSGNPYADTPQSLIYTLTNLPTHGALSLAGSALQVGDQFTQEQIDKNLLTYTEDGSSATSDFFGFSIADAFVHNNFGSGTFNITITNNSGGRNLVTSSSSDVFYSGPGNNWIMGNSGTTLSYALAPAGVNVNLGAGTADNGFGGIDTISDVHSLTGSPFGDLLSGTNVDDVFAGGKGNDTIDGGPGTDTAVFSGSYLQYQGVALGGDAFQVIDQRSGSPDGTDTIANVEFLQFADGTYRLSEVETKGTTALVEVGDYFLLGVIGGPGVTLKYSGSVVVAGQFGAWIPLGAEATSGGYEVAWKYGAADQYTVWSTDSNGDYVSNIVPVGPGTSSSLEINRDQLPAGSQRRWHDGLGHDRDRDGW